MKIFSNKTRLFKSILTVSAAIAVIITTSCLSNAQKADLPPTYVAVKHNGAVLLTAPKAGASTVAPLKMGEIYRLIGEPVGKYVKARNIATGAEGYLETAVVNHTDSPLTSPTPADEEVSEPLLVNVETFGQGESIVGWDFWKAPDGSIRVIESRTVVYNDGRARANQSYYKATAMDGYLLVTESVDYGAENGTKLETPIIIWHDIVDNAGVFIDGKLYAPNNPGGIDTDDWDN